MASSRIAAVTSMPEVKANDPNQNSYRSQILRDQNLAAESSIRQRVSHGDGKCTCCPFGYHIDLDFLSVCHDSETESTLQHLKKIQRNKRQLRKSMEVMLSEQEAINTDSAPVPPDIVIVNEAGHLMNMIDHERSASHHILKQIDSSVSTATATVEEGSMRRYVQSDKDEGRSFYSKHPGATNSFGELSHINTAVSTFSRGESSNSLSSLSDSSGDIPAMYQAELLQQQQQYYSRSDKSSTKIMENPVLEMVTAEIKHPSSETVTLKMEHPVLEMATAEMKHYSTTSSAQLTDIGRDKTAPIKHVERQTITTNYHETQKEMNELTIQSLQETLAQYQQQIKVLQEQVKTIPILQVRISVLKEEKRLLDLQLKATKTSNHNQQNSSLGVADALDRNEDYIHSSQTLEFSKSRTADVSSLQQKSLMEKSPVQTLTRPVSTVSVGVGDHSVIEPYKLQPDLPVGYTVRENKSDFEICSRTVLEQDWSIKERTFNGLLQQIPNHDILGSEQRALSTQQTVKDYNQSHFTVSQSHRSSPKIFTRSIGVGDSNVFDSSGLSVHEKELRTVIIGQNVVPKRNVGIECRVPTRDVGVSFLCDNEKPETRTIGVNVSYDTSGILTTLDFKGEAELRMALQGVLQRSVRSVGTSCHFEQATREQGTITDFSAGVNVGCGDEGNTVDVEIRPATVRRSAAVTAKPDVGNKCVSTDSDWVQDASTNTYQTNTYDKAVMTDKKKQIFASTNTESVHTHVTSNQTEQSMFIRLDQIKHTASNTEMVKTYSTGMSTDIIPTLNASVNTVEKVNNLFSKEVVQVTTSSMKMDTEQLKAHAGSDDKTNENYKLSETIKIQAAAPSSKEEMEEKEQTIHGSSSHESTFQNRSEYTRKSSTFNDGNKHYSSLEISTHSAPLSRSYTGSWDTRSHSQEVQKVEDMSPTKSDEKFSETVVEHYVITKDGKKLISEEKITTSSSGTNRSFRQYANETSETSQTSVPEIISSHSTETGNCSVEGNSVGSLQYSDFNSRGSSITSSQNTVKEKAYISKIIPSNPYKTVHNLAALSSILESDAAENNSELQHASMKVNEEHTYGESLLGKSSRAEKVTTGSVEDFMPDSVRKYMNIDPISTKSGEDTTQSFLTESSSASSSSSVLTTSVIGEMKHFKAFDTNISQSTKSVDENDGQVKLVTEEAGDKAFGELEARIDNQHTRLLAGQGVSDVSSSSSATTYSSSFVSGLDLSRFSTVSTAVDQNMASERSDIATTGITSFSDTSSLTVSDESRSTAEISSDVSSKKEARKLKSIMKHKTDIQNMGNKKGITFADSVTGGYELPDEVRSACLVMAAYLVDSTTIQSKQLNANQNIIQQEWFQVSSHKMSDAAHVEEFLSSVNEISKRLLEYIINMSDANGNTAIHYCVSHSNFEIVNLLLDSDVCDISKRNNAGYTPIMLAGLISIENLQQREVMKRLMSQGEINAGATSTHQTALMLAASHGRMETVRLLVEEGADVNMQDEDGSTALMCACEHGHLEIVNFLLMHPDIDANITDNEKCTALSIAMDAGHKDVGVALYKHLNFSKLPSPVQHKKRKSSYSFTLSNFGV